MGTFDELVTNGKEFAMMLASLQEGKEDSDSLSGVSKFSRLGVYSTFAFTCMSIHPIHEN